MSHPSQTTSAANSQPASQDTSQANGRSTIYALLIGINHYAPNSLYSDLRGCVRDIDLVNTYLRGALNIPEQQIWKLTAPSPDDSALADLRSAEKLPTYRNIVESFEAVTAAANAGDQIYIHYSGHGGRAKTLYPDIKGDTEQWDESIVPTDFCTPGGRYLHDVEIATLLKRMTDKQAIVTIVLDSCHSGGATRGDSDIRGPQDDRVDDQEPATKSLVADEQTLAENWRTLTSGASTESAAMPWLPPSRDYVCLAACRPAEKAREYPATGQDRNGALTFWMIDTLNSNTIANLDYRALHERVSAKIQGLFPDQSPVLMGEDNRRVFGTDLANRQYTAKVLKVEPAKQQVTLQVGLAQGMSRGTRFALYPYGTTDFSDPQGKLALAEVSQLKATTCFAKLLSPAEGGLDTTSLLTDPEQLQGAPAVMESAPAALKRRVRLVDDKEIGNHALALPESLAGQQQSALQKVQDALTDNGWLSPIGDEAVSNEAGNEQDAHFQVAVNQTGHYEICMGLPIENLRPPIAISDSAGAKEIVERLVHLAKYQSIQAIDNPKSRLTGYLKVELMQQPDWQPGDDYNPIPFDNPQAIELAAGSFAFLRIENAAGAPLNIAVMDLEPTWAISRISFLNLSSSENTLAPGETQIIPLQFSLPSGEADKSLYSQANETIKVFAALGTVDFSWLALPELDGEIEYKGATRGAGDEALSKLMSAIGSQKPTLTRAAVAVVDPNQEWTTKQVHFTIVQ
ncbi:MAG: caspase family protein [Cyanobacteria bacterium J06629_19]